MAVWHVRQPHDQQWQVLTSFGTQACARVVAQHEAIAAALQLASEGGDAVLAHQQPLGLTDGVAGGEGLVELTVLPRAGQGQRGVGGKYLTDDLSLVAEVDSGPAIEVQRAERVLLHVEAERDHAAGAELAGSGTELRSAGVVAQLVDDDRLLVPDRIQARAADRRSRLELISRLLRAHSLVETGEECGLEHGLPLGRQALRFPGRLHRERITVVARPLTEIDSHTLPDDGLGQTSMA